MIVWINGAYGAGKTSVARRLSALRASAHLLDPEQIGFMLRGVWPDRGRADFKDLPIWRDLTFSILRAAAKENNARLIIVPMTLDDPRHFDEIVGRLRRDGVDVRHFTLTASPETLHRRLRRRLDWPRSKRWALSRVDSCAVALADAALAVHIPTEGRSIGDVAAEILEKIGD